MLILTSLLELSVSGPPGAAPAIPTQLCHFSSFGLSLCFKPSPITRSNFYLLSCISMVISLQIKYLKNTINIFIASMFFFFLFQASPQKPFFWVKSITQCLVLLLLSSYQGEFEFLRSVQVAAFSLYICFPAKGMGWKQEAPGYCSVPLAWAPMEHPCQMPNIAGAGVKKGWESPTLGSLKQMVILWQQPPCAALECTKSPLRSHSHCHSASKLVIHRHQNPHRVAPDPEVLSFSLSWQIRLFDAFSYV